MKTPFIHPQHIHFGVHMKRIILSLMLLATFCLFTTAHAESWNLEALKTQAGKAVPNGQVADASADEYSAYVALMDGGNNYQFTLSSDQEPQAPGAWPLTYKGHKAFFFETGMPGHGGLMILLSADKSLTIVSMAGFDSDAEPDESVMTKLADKMDLGVL